MLCSISLCGKYNDTKGQIQCILLDLSSNAIVWWCYIALFCGITWLIKLINHNIFISLLKTIPIFISNKVTMLFFYPNRTTKFANHGKNGALNIKLTEINEHYYVYVCNWLLFLTGN